MKVLEPYLGKFIRVYLDDFCVYGGRANHVEQLRFTFERLILFQCSLSLEKCCFGFKESTLLGHVVFVGIKVDPGKISAILALEPPTSTQEVKKMWGKIGYHNRFINNLTEIGRPIIRLLSKQPIFNWAQECSTAFQYIKLQLSSNQYSATRDGIDRSF